MTALDAENKIGKLEAQIAVRDKMVERLLAEIKGLREQAANERWQDLWKTERRANEKLIEALMWMDTHDPQLIAAAETKFGFSLAKAGETK